MTILIKGMEMPKPGSYDGRLTVTLNGDALFYLFHEYGAHPAKEIPPHGRLIDADALLEHLGDTEYKGAVKRVLMQAPTIIEGEPK